MENVEVIHYSNRALRHVFTQYSLASKQDVEAKAHLKYFEGYCNDIGVSTLVIEKNYIDTHYLDDFSNYYVRCFHSYKKSCSRVHFFAKSFNREEFKNILSGQNSSLENNDLQEAYRGFVVIKPLPNTFIGTTCLKTYDGHVRRNFPIAREYCVHLFGIKLTVESLAFQEQDKAVAICATNALWSVFQGTGVLWHHEIPSPIEITKTALSQSSPESRTLVNKGLDVPHLARGIRSVGLEPYIVNVADHYALKSSVYSYLSFGIPVILTFGIYDTDNSNTHLGNHAVAVTGYSLDPSANITPFKGFNNISTKIDKIYVHDDQVGPFAKMGFDNKSIAIQQGDNKLDLITLSTSFPCGNPNSARALSGFLVVPLYHKIRISFEEIHNCIMNFDAIIDSLAKYMSLNSKLQWRIVLADVNSIKNEWRESEIISTDKRLKYLTQNLPRFIWCAEAFENKDKKIQLLFDATDINQGEYLLRCIVHDPAIKSVLKTVFNDDSYLAYRASLVWRIISWFRKHY